MKQKNLFLFFMMPLVLSFGFFKTIYASKSQIVHQIIQSLSPEENENLELLFKRLIFEEGFGYVLLGTKPMAMSHFIRPLALHKCFDSIPALVNKYNWKLQQALQIWEKYQHFFPLKSYFFKCNYSVWDARVSIILINKEYFLKKVENHLEDFCTVLQKKLNPEMLLQESELEKILQHDALTGILLGYGRNNAWSFYKKQQLSSAWNEEERFSIEGYFENKKTKKKYRISLPGFAANSDDQETILLKQEYLECRKKLIDYYQDKDFLEATLHLLIR